MSLEQLLVFLVIGGVAGWIAGLILKGGGFGLIGPMEFIPARISALQNSSRLGDAIHFCSAKLNQTLRAATS